MQIRCKLVLVAMLCGSAAVQAEQRENQVRTDRYTLVKAEARDDQKSPLKSIVNLSLGKDVLMVGDALREVLKGSGYRWQSPDGQDQLLNTLPLPSVIRELGPVTLSDALQTIAGEAWQLRSDTLHRVIWFDVRDTTPTVSLKE
jgi:conjugative transfer region protein (TIGR03748 family)